VNPNSPTGQHIPRIDLERILKLVSCNTKVWVDETYIEYAGDNQSIEEFAARSDNVIVCKSMSKVYALSGARVAYLCGPARLLGQLRGLTPPWAVSLPGQIAAVAALQDPNYYAARYEETHQLRNELASELSRFVGWEILPGVANFLLCQLPESGPDAASLVRHCRTQGLYLRDAGAMGWSLGRHSLRIAVKDKETNERMLRIIAEANDTIQTNGR
jgi:histidinol-phosphate/aromatic aminotransferase/cobyric acid decarboxylase-like protein